MYDDIVKTIQSGKYNKTKRADGFAVNKCNLFVDDVSKQYYGVNFPRYGELQNQFYKGWAHRPLPAFEMRHYLNGATLLDSSGVKRVGREDAWKAAGEGALVIATDGIHASVMAPTKDRPKIYRSDQADREEEKYDVGVSDKFDFFQIDPERYKTFRAGGYMKEIGLQSTEDFIRYGEEVSRQVDRTRGVERPDPYRTSGYWDDQYGEEDFDVN